MKVAISWLNDWVKTPASMDTLVHELTMAGLEVDSVQPACKPFKGVVAAQILSCSKHPEADALAVYSVDRGDAKPCTVVSSDLNLAVGTWVAYAPVGATLNGQVLTSKKLKNLESFGMLCSEQDLGLQETSSHVWRLDDYGLSLGQELRDWLQADDTVLDIDLTPNRGDCANILGVARELSILFNTPLLKSPLSLAKSFKPTKSDVLQVDIKTSGCSLYTGRLIQGINQHATTPIYIIERLRRGGIRHIHPVVDCLNYLMLELGQPMHAFDASTLKGTIVCREAKAGEQIALLEGHTLSLREGGVVIADDNRVLALAGVMGGQDSRVTSETVDIFLESAVFDAAKISVESRHYNLHTDSAYRFARGIDSSMTQTVLDIATTMILEICGGQAGPMTVTGSAVVAPAIPLRYKQIERLLGVVISQEQVEQFLSRCGATLTKTSEGWEVIPPGFRNDWTMECDLIEEVARLYGYNNISTSNLMHPLKLNATKETIIPRHRLRHLMLDAGFVEAITYSFVSPDWQQQLHPSMKTLKVSNPIASDMSAMRTSLWSGLLKAAQYNVARQQKRVCLFETGLRFVHVGDTLVQEEVLSGLMTGSAQPEQWGVSSREVDFYDIKGVVDSLIALTDSPSDWWFEAKVHEALHPGQSAAIYLKNELVGWIGALHPAHAKTLDCPSALLFEIKMDALSFTQTKRAATLSKFPSLRRDIAVVVEKSIPVDKLKKMIEATLGNILKQCLIFDIYQGKGLEENQRSIAFGLVLQHAERTLEEKEIQQALSLTLQGLEASYGAKLR